MTPLNPDLPFNLGPLPYIELGIATILLLIRTVPFRSLDIVRSVILSDWKRIPAGGVK